MGTIRGKRHPLQEQSAGQRVVIVGTGEWAAMALEYFHRDSPYEVVAFSAEAPYAEDGSYCGLPVVPLDQLAAEYPPSEYKAFVAVSLTQLSRLRRRLYNTVQAAGFDCVSYVSSDAFVLASAEIGQNVFVFEKATLEFRVRVGDNVFLGCGTCVGHSTVIEDDCWSGPNATVCGWARVGRGCFLGAGSCVIGGVTVGEDCVVGAGAVLLRDTKPRQVYVGNPARPTGRDSFDVFGVRTG